MNSGNNQFHDHDSDEIFDLYNAVNGERYEGLLDIRKLDELTDEEREIFDVPRLKELGAHVISGCAQCEAIINTLDWARGRLKKEMSVASPKQKNWQ